VQVAMLALSYSLSYWIGFVIAWVLLARRLGSLDSGRTVWMLARVLVAGVLAGVAMMGMYVWVVTNQLGEPNVGWQARVILLLAVVATSVVGTAVFLVAAWALRVREVSDVLSLMRRASARLRIGGST